MSYATQLCVVVVYIFPYFKLELRYKYWFWKMYDWFKKFNWWIISGSSIIHEFIFLQAFIKQQNDEYNYECVVLNVYYIYCYAHVCGTWNKIVAGLLNRLNTFFSVSNKHIERFTNNNVLLWTVSIIVYVHMAYMQKKKKWLSA